MNPQTPPIQTNNQPPQVIIADTDLILSGLSKNKDLAEKSRGLVSAFALTGFYYFGINEVTFFECFKHLNPSRIEDFNKYLGIFRHFYIDKPALGLAADLMSFYKEDKYIKDHLKMSTEDLLISATAIFTGGYVLTGNFYDFPHPFFKCIYQHKIMYAEKSIPKMKVFYLLQADYEVVNDARSEWFKTKTPNANQQQLGV